MHLFPVAAVALLLTGCATAPVAADPGVDPRGRWTVIAVDGKPTGGGRRFNLDLRRPYGSAQFGCNTGSGSFAVRDGWFIPQEPWIVTVASCPNPQSWVQFERKGFQILAKPLAAERRGGGGVRLRNELGSIDLIEAPPVTVTEIAGTWQVVSINGVGTPADDTFQVRIAGNELDGRFGCNRYSAEFRIENGHYSPLMARYTEMACELVGPNALSTPVMTLEEWAFAVLRSRPEVVLGPGTRLAFVSSKGRIEMTRVFER